VPHVAFVVTIVADGGILMPQCPVCGSRAFVDFNGRRAARCAGCGALERGRYQWMVLQRCVRLPPGATVAHFAPERFFMDHFASLPGVEYRAFDKFPQHYRHDRVRVSEFDLCKDRDSLPTAAFDLVMHSHVLEHLPCAFEPVLADMKRLLKPGGLMLFSVPIDGETTREGIDPAANDEERALRARQGEHLRVFGRSDFQAIAADILGADSLVLQRNLFTEAELQAAGVPVVRKGEPTGKSVFLYRKP
jgi:SAM-dependent methyltransferase